MSKQNQLEEFDKFIGNAPETAHFLENKVCFVCGQPFNKSKQVEELRNLFSKSMDLIRAEAIQEARESIPCYTDGYLPPDETMEHRKTRNETLKEVREELNKLS